METSGHSVELKISKVLSDIRQKGYSSLQPFSIGKVELLIITQMPPFRTSWLYLVSPFTLQRYNKFPKLPNFLAKFCFLFVVTDADEVSWR